MARRTSAAHSGERVPAHQPAPASGSAPARTEQTNTIGPMVPAKTGTTWAKKESTHSARSANLNARPSALKRRDSLAARSSTRTVMNENDASNDELLK